MSDSGFPFPPPGDEEREIARIADSLQMETSAPSAKPKPSPSSMPISLPLALPPQGMTHPAGIPPGGRPGPTPTANLDPATKGKLLHGLVKDLKEGKITKEQFSQQLIQTVGRHQALQIINKTQGGSRPAQPVPALPQGAKPPPTAAPQPQSLPPQAPPTSSAGQNQMMMLKMQQQGKLPNAPVPIARPQGGQPVDPQMQRLLQLQLQQQMNMGAKIPLPSAEEQRKMLMFANRLPQGTLPPQVGGVAMPQPQAGAIQPAAKKARTAGPAAGGNPPKGGSQVKAEKESDKGGGNRNETLKDLSDVTRIAGVNLKEETNTFMASMPTAGESSEPDVDAINPLLNRQLLQKKVHAILAANGLQSTVGDPIYELITLALTERMRDILEHLATFAEHRQVTRLIF